MFGVRYGIPLTNTLKRVNLCLALGFIFDSLWYMEKALFPDNRVTPFELLLYMYVYAYTYAYAYVYYRKLLQYWFFKCF